LHIDAALEVDCSLFIRQLLFLAGINPMSSVVVLPSTTLTRLPRASKGCRPENFLSVLQCRPASSIVKQSDTGCSLFLESRKERRSTKDWPCSTSGVVPIIVYWASWSEIFSITRGNRKEGREASEREEDVAPASM